MAPTLKEWYLNRLMLDPKDQIDMITLIDTETTHLNGFTVSIAIIGFSLKDMEVKYKYYKEINPQVDISEESFEIHKISDEQVKDAPKFEHFEKEITQMLEESEMTIAFNAIYDIATIIREYERLGIKPPRMPYLDLMNRLKVEVDAKNSVGHKKNPTLKEAAEYFKITSVDQNLHNALYDTEVMLETFVAALKSYE